MRPRSVRARPEHNRDHARARSHRVPALLRVHRRDLQVRQREQLRQSAEVVVRRDAPEPGAAEEEEEIVQERDSRWTIYQGWTTGEFRGVHGHHRQGKVHEGELVPRGFQSHQRHLRDGLQAAGRGDSRPRDRAEEDPGVVARAHRKPPQDHAPLHRQ